MRSTDSPGWAGSPLDPVRPIWFGPAPVPGWCWAAAWWYGSGRGTGRGSGPGSAGCTVAWVSGGTGVEQRSGAGTGTPSETSGAGTSACWLLSGHRRGH